MSRIDPETEQRILSTADIVEVVSDFVTLKRSGANYMGLCPFHNERTPSFSVSKAKNICRCFSCGKGGGPVKFIMEHESLSYPEALRWLANKYNIEIKERELTAEEQAAASERESMFAVNDFALNFFEHTLMETQEGVAVGLSYFRERGLTDAAIKKFRLGFSPEKYDALATAATAKGYKAELLRAVGLCNQSEKGKLYDRFRGRVIYPVFTLSGKVLAFGGRTLQTSKEVAKYVNSPESLIYHKSDTLYGMYQARRAIVSKDKCILVEGYMDVISMSQRGVENVVASSGTSLTEGQIALIHRFTENVTVIYDADAAGIKASLRGIDMFLAQGLNVKCLLLPEGEDPDSFAKAHTLEEIEQYMAENETDFIRFKANIMLQGVEHDPVARAGVISSMAKSISLIPNQVLRSEYVKECARQLNTTEEIVALEVSKLRNQALDKEGRENPTLREVAKTVPDATVPKPNRTEKSQEGFMRASELELMRLITRYGLLSMGEVVDEQGNSEEYSVIDMITHELEADGIGLVNGDLAALYEEVKRVSEQWETAKEEATNRALEKRSEYIDAQRQALMGSGLTMIQIERREKQITEQADTLYFKYLAEQAENYIARSLGANPDSTIQELTAQLVNEKYTQSKMYDNDPSAVHERDRLAYCVPKALSCVKYDTVRWRYDKNSERLKSTTDPEEQGRIMMELKADNELIRLMSPSVGDRTYIPRR